MSRLQVEPAGLARVEGSIAGAADARRTWDHRATLELRLRSEFGVATGEAAPLPGYSSDTLDEVGGALSRLGPMVLDLTAPLESIEAELRRIPAALPSARFALEQALLELAAEALELGSEVLLAPRTPDATGAPSEMPRVAEALFSLEGATEEARSLEAEGWTALKLKVGRPGAFEAERRVVGEVRRVFGGELRLDANQAFEEDMQAKLHGLRGLGVDLLEEPAPVESWWAVHELERDPRIALDESLRRSDARDRLETWAPRIGALVLKPTVLGGALAALEWARAGAALGIPSMVSHTHEGPRASAALRSLARALPASGPAHGLGRLRGGEPRLPPEERFR